MQKDPSSISDENYINDIAFNNIIFKQFIQKALELERKKVPIDKLVGNVNSVFDLIFRTNVNKIDVIRKTMKDNSGILNKEKIIDYLDDEVFPRIRGMLDFLSSKTIIYLKLSPKILDIIFSTYKLFIKIIKIEMKEFREIQKIVADSLLNKDAIQDIRNKIQKSKENVTKKNIDDKEEKEINISDKIKELRKLNYSINDNNQESMKKYISKLEDDLEEKEAFIKELLFEEYIHQENCDKYQNKIEMQIKQIEKYNQKIHELEKLAKKSEHEKSLLNKKIHILNNEIDDFKDKVLYLSKEKSELNEKNSKLEKNLCVLSEENKYLNENIKLLIEKNNNISDILFEKSSENESLKNDNFLLKIIITRKDDKIHDMEKDIKYMKTEAQKFASEFDELKKNIHKKNLY